MIYGSICSGIESASMAWEPLGMRPAWFAEVEPFPSAVLEHHWPHVANLGDMCNLPYLVSAGIIDAPDILVGGTPCQDFSVAGLRQGLKGERGQLTMKFVELANEIDKKRKDNECIVVWENVPGVLSSKDNAFGCFLGALAGEDCELKPAGKKWTNAGCVFGPERAIAWRVLDAQYFGVAQRRRRVFVVASAREGFDPSKVLFESESLRRDTAPSRTAGQEIAGTLASRTNGGGFPGTDEALSGYLTPHITGAITARFGGQAMGAPEVDANLYWPFNGHAVRRLTPVECERLQGFPDNHTLLPYGVKQKLDEEMRQYYERHLGRVLTDDEQRELCADGPRYKAIGNSKAVPVIKFIGERILNELNTMGY